MNGNLTRCACPSRGQFRRRGTRANLAPMTPRLASCALLCALSLALVACATQTPPPPVQPPAASQPAAVEPPPPPLSPPGQALPSEPAPPPVPNDQPLAVAKAEFVADTAARFDIEPAYIQSVLAQAELRDSIIEAMSRPAERSKTWGEYRPIFVNQAGIAAGQAFLAEHRQALEQVEKQYGVPAEIIVAILGVETRYGRITGSYPVVDALYTLAFSYPRTNEPGEIARENQREAFFRDELAQLFALGKETGLDITTLEGSYAGAMGWGQFMPSSYRDYAVDGNGDGTIDLFHSLDDVFASVANYFVEKGGWQPGEPVAVRATRDPGAKPYEPDTLKAVHTLADLAARGYRPVKPVPQDLRATLINLDGDNGPEYWIGFQNFYAITRYNNSRMYAMAVYQLAEAIAGRSDPLALAPHAGRDSQPRA